MALDPLRESLSIAAKDGAAWVARRAMCHALSAGFHHTGQILRTAGHIIGPQRVDGTSPFGNGDDRLVALGYLGESAAALITGAVDLIERDNPYAASALNRQLVEVEYLIWAFVEDQEEAASWLRSTRRERLQRWQPRHLRDRSQGRFPDRDYEEHCEVGGHPTPKGLRALLGAASTATAEIIVSETANHAAGAWKYLLLAVDTDSQNHTYEPTGLIPDETVKAVSAAQTEWRRTDRLVTLWQERSNTA